MKAKELRIGNYVDVPRKDQSPFRIDAFESLSKTFVKVAMVHPEHGENFHPLTWYGDDLTPIPLTEEWHNKFGVIKSGFESFEYSLPIKNNMYIKVIFIGDYVMLRQGEGNHEDDVVSIWNKDLTKRDMYVHEWQNLYFALTGEELTLIEDHEIS